MVGRIVSLALLGLVGMWVSPAMAYIDPGSGSAIMSAVIGFFVPPSPLPAPTDYALDADYLPLYLAREFHMRIKSIHMVFFWLLHELKGEMSVPLRGALPVSCLPW